MGAIGAGIEVGVMTKSLEAKAWSRERFSWCDRRQRYSAAAQAFKPLSKGSARETPCRRGRWDSGM